MSKRFCKCPNECVGQTHFDFHLTFPGSFEVLIDLPLGRAGAPAGRVERPERPAGLADQINRGCAIGRAKGVHS